MGYALRQSTGGTAAIPRDGAHALTPPQCGDDRAPQPPFFIGGVRVNAARQEATGPRCGTVALSARELTLLGFFAAHRGEVLVRDRLLASVWDAARRRRTTRTVDQHICVLRRKLGGDGVLIETVHRAGYRVK